MTAARRLVLVVLALAVALASVTAPAGAVVEESPATPLNLHQWGAVTLFHGLPSDHVRAIAADADGTLWFGTDGGLARYDGRRTQTVVSGAVRALARDESGALWVGTDDGASRIVDGRAEPIPETVGFEITAILTAGPDRVLLASSAGTLFTRTATGVETRGPDDDALLRGAEGPLPLTSLAAAGDAILIGTRGRGLLSLTGGELEEVASRSRPFFVETIASDAEGGAWYGAQARGDEGGLYDASALARQRRVASATGTVAALAFDASGDLWAGTDGHGAVRYRDGREVEHLTFEGSGGGLRSDRVYAVYVDREGVVWFGTDRGVCRYDARSPLVEAFSSEPEGNFVRAVLRDSAGRSWCGTSRGLYMKEPGGAWQSIAELERRTVYSLADAGGGRVLAGTGSALFAIDAQARATRIGLEEVADTGGVRAIRTFQGRTYVARFGRGVERLDGDRLVLVWPDASAAAGLRDVVSLFASDEALWIGTADEGAYAFDGATARPAFPEIASDAVWGMDRGRDGTLWIATGRGLFAATTGRAEPVLDGVEARCVVAGEADGTAWCGTARGGVFAVGRDPLAGALAARLDTEHGLPSDGVFALYAAGDPGGGPPALLIGTSRGIARYEPGRVPAALRVTRALGARAYDPAEVAAGLALEYPQNSLALDVAATSSRTFPEQFQYAFAVFDAGDHLVTSKLSHDAQLTLANLRPGRYRVEARAYTNDLVPSEPLTLAFDVERAPFPWGVAALSLLLAVALVALWWGGQQNRRLATANRELGEARLQLAHETESERRRIARDLHDQTLADLRQLLMRTDEEPNAPPARAEIEAISNEIRRICEDLSPSVLANVGLTAALEWALSNAVAHMPEGEKFEYEFACDDGVEERLGLDPNEQIQVYRIVQEAINNVCRHAKASHVRLHAELDADGVFVVALEDDGRGFDPSSRTGRLSRGLNNIRSRASMIGADVSWRRRSSGGTVFTLKKS